MVEALEKAEMLRSSSSNKKISSRNRLNKNTFSH